MHITKIELQKKNKKRFNLYTNDIFLFAVSEDTLVHFQIGKDKEYSDSELQEIQHYEDVMMCIHQAYRYLSRRPHLATELKRKLKQKEFNYPIIEEAILYLTKHKYLNDKDFIKRYVSDQIRIKRSGPLMIYKKLYEKGASREMAESEVSSVYSEELQIENAAYLAKKKTKNPLEYSYKKLVAHLQQKGYSWEIIKQLPYSETEGISEN